MNQPPPLAFGLAAATSERKGKTMNETKYLEADKEVVERIARQFARTIAAQMKAEENTSAAKIGICVPAKTEYARGLSKALFDVFGVNIRFSARGDCRGIIGVEIVPNGGTFAVFSWQWERDELLANDL